MKPLKSTRFVLFVFVCLALSASAFAATLTVTKTADANDGVCDADCSLREAIAVADANGAADTINFSVNGTFQMTGADYVVTTPIIIEGSGADLTVIRSSGASRIFYLGAGGNLDLRGVTVTNGVQTQGGAIIQIRGSTLTIQNSAITNNRTSGFIGAGGAIIITGSGNAPAYLTVKNSTVSGNQTPGDFVTGGAIFAQGGEALGGMFVTIINSTFANNSSDYGGAIYMYSGSLTITDSTLTANNSKRGGAIYNYAAGVTIHNSIVAANAATMTGATDISSGVTSQGYNIIGNTTGNSGWTATDLQNVSPLLATLGNYGGRTQTCALLANSPAINAADPTTFEPFDQRGVSRPRGGRADIGAYEHNNVISNVSGGNDFGSLRQTLAEAFDGETITFDPTFFNTPRTLDLSGGGEIGITKPVTIQGPGANLLTISGGNLSRVFSIAPGLSGVTISGVTITQGGNVPNGGAIFASSRLNLTNVVLDRNAAGTSGGAVYNNYQTISLTDCTVSNNQAPQGAGIYVQNFGSGTPSLTGILNVRSSTFNGNIASSSGGGVTNSYGTTRVTNSTFSGNSSQFGGSAIYHSNNRPFLIVNSTVTNNTDANASAIYADNGGTVNNSIIAANNGADILGSFSGGANNLIGNGDGTIFQNGVNGNIVGTAANPVDPKLDALLNNGGATQTHALQATSPAKNAGDNSLAVDAETGQPLMTDQRGLARIVQSFAARAAAAVDIGAFEIQPPTAASALVRGRVLDVTGRGVFRAVISLTDANGNTRTTISNQFGFFRFSGVATGETYVFDARHKRHLFAPQVLTVNEEMTSLNFIESK